MKLFIDTANIEEIKICSELKIIDGITTNPSLIAKEGKKLNEIIDTINNYIDGPISGEIKATTTDYKNIIEEAINISKLHKNMVVKIPMTKDGIIAISELSKMNIKTNATLVFSVSQAILAAKAGATYISLFVGRYDDISTDGLSLIYDVVEAFNNYDFASEIIAASIRSPLHVSICAKAGVDIATIPFKVLMQMFEHPLTTQGIDKFIKDYKKVFKENE